ncbi:MAG: hypothetical protein ACW97O_08555 [Candidatus Thorarchaeota archaeon]|jgi:hypothetical protein
MKTLISSLLVVLMLLLPSMVYAGGRGCNRGGSSSSVRYVPSYSGSSNNGGTGHASVTQMLGNLALLKALMQRGEERSEIRELLLVLLPLMISKLSENGDNGAAQQMSPQIFVLPDGTVPTTSWQGNVAVIPKRAFDALRPYARFTAHAKYKGKTVYRLTSVQIPSRYLVANSGDSRVRNALSRYPKK